MSPRKSFKYVYIPCDPACAMEELTMEIPEGREMECLLDTLKEHFRNASGTLGTSAEQKALFRKQLEEQSGKKIDDDMMDIASRMQMVQPVALLPGGKATNWEHVNLYVDDRGISKGLRRNDRACGLALECGAPTDIVGDAFLARILDDDDRFDARFVAHAWLMTLAWAVLIPLGVWSARYARRPPEAPPSPSALAESIRRGWFACHKVFAGLGLAAAALGWLLAHRAVDDVLGEEAHLDTAHACYGAGALLLGLYQPLNAWLRPPGPEHPGDARSPARARWEVAHRIAAAGGCALSVAATATGLDRAEEAWGAERGARAGGRAYAAWLVAIAIATAALERARFRERKGAWEGGGAGARTFVELSEDVGAGEEDRDPDPRGEEEA